MQLLKYILYFQEFHFFEVLHVFRTETAGLFNSLCEKCPYSEFLWRIRTECGPETFHFTETFHTVTMYGLLVGIRHERVKIP